MSLENMPRRIREKILQEANEGEEYTPLPNCLHITELVGCLRKAFYRRTQPKRALSLETAVNFHRGKLWDRDFTSCYKHNQVRVTYRCRNVHVSISGHFDFIDDDDPANPVVTDLKSPKTLFYVEREGKPSQHYVEQVLFYCYCTAIPRGRVAYWDGSRWLPFDVEVTDEAERELIEKLETRAMVLWLALKTGKAPLKSAANFEEWECKFCGFKDLCDVEAEECSQR